MDPSDYLETFLKQSVECIIFSCMSILSVCLSIRMSVCMPVCRSLSFFCSIFSLFIRASSSSSTKLTGDTCLPWSFVRNVNALSYSFLVLSLIHRLVLPPIPSTSSTSSHSSLHLFLHPVVHLSFRLTASYDQS